MRAGRVSYMARADAQRRPDVQRRPNKAAGVSLIFLGGFNPVIFQPAWFMRNGLIPDDDDSVEMEAVTNQMTVWGQSWFKVVVVAERCEFHATDEIASFKGLHDIADGVFSLLPHVPLSSFGVNRFAHFQLESEDAWNRLGFSLFTREPWEGVLGDARMRTVQVQSQRADEVDGAFTVTVQPSTQFKTAVFVSTNDHYVVDPNAAGAQEALDRVAQVFDRSVDHSGAVIEQVRAL